MRSVSRKQNDVARNGEMRKDNGQSRWAVKCGANAIIGIMHNSTAKEGVDAYGVWSVYFSTSRISPFSLVSRSLGPPPWIFA